MVEKHQSDLTAVIGPVWSVTTGTAAATYFEVLVAEGIKVYMV